jgi:hypothetical protein
LKEFLISQKVCVFCYGWMNDDAHGVEKGGTLKDLRCPMKKRLRALLYVHGRRTDGSFLDFIRATYASEEIFNNSTSFCAH